VTDSHQALELLITDSVQKKYKMHKQDKVVPFYRLSRYTRSRTFSSVSFDGIYRLHMTQSS